MSGKGLAELRRMFADRYDALRHRVARRLGGSSELAGDALHEAYLRLADDKGLEGVRHPQTYLVNTAVHAAIDRLRADTRHLDDTEIDALFELADDTPGPAQVFDARHDLSRMLAVIDALPPRQRDILISARLHDVPRAELAKRWGISLRLVGRELKTAHEHCTRAMEDASSWTP